MNWFPILAVVIWLGPAAFFIGLNIFGGVDDR